MLRTLLLQGVLWVALAASLRGESPVNRSLTKENDELKKKIQTLQEEIVLAKAEAKNFYESWIKLKLENESLGLEILTGDDRLTHEKIVRLTGNLYRSELEKKNFQATLDGVIAAAIAMANLKPDSPQDEKIARRADFEAAIRAAKSALRGDGVGDPGLPGTLTMAEIVDVDHELGVAILNLGKSQGAFIGMEFLLVSENDIIGECKLVELRENLSAALLGEFKNKEKITAGLRARVKTNK